MKQITRRGQTPAGDPRGAGATSVGGHSAQGTSRQHLHRLDNDPGSVAKRQGRLGHPPSPTSGAGGAPLKSPEGPQGAERCPTPGALSEPWRPEAACTRDYVCSAARPLRPGPMPRGTGARLTEAAGGPGPLACSGGLRAGGGRSSSGRGRDERRRLRWPHADTPVPPDDSPSLPQTGTASPYCSATGASDQVPHK